MSFTEVYSVDSLDAEFAFPDAEHIRVRLSDLVDGRHYWRYYLDCAAWRWEGHEVICRTIADGAFKFVHASIPNDTYGTTYMSDMGLAPYQTESGVAWTFVFLTSAPLPSGVSPPLPPRSARRLIGVRDKGRKGTAIFQVKS